jgi:hypothetical protein
LSQITFVVDSNAGKGHCWHNGNSKIQRFLIRHSVG